MSAANVITLHGGRPADDVAATLRRTADAIDAGAIDFPVTTAIVVLGHSDAEVPCGNGELAQQNYWRTYVSGVRTDAFTARGLLATVLNRWGSEY